jgi:5'-deoxynucleotidase YfbR-like HD superfamily hydrolase
MATIHDWSEALTADIPYPAHKYLGGKDTKDHLNSGAATELLAQYPNLLSVWREYHEGKTAEAKLVRASDYLSMLLQYLAYLERGYNSAELEDLWKAVKDDLAPFAAEFPPLRELVDELEKLRKDRIGGSRR